MTDARRPAEAPSVLSVPRSSPGSPAGPIDESTYQEDLHAASAAESAELAVVTRAGVVESRHIGSAVVVGPDGAVLESIGSPQRLMFPRSTLKPFQAIASLRSGALISPEAVALACGSHVGSRKHQELAASILAAEGLDESALKCPAAWPARNQDLRVHLEAGKTETPLAFNCSGKHGAFLAATRTNGWRLNTYLERSHPLQRVIMDVVTEYCDEAPTVVGVDGCGAPAPALSLTGLAHGFSKLAASTSRRDAEVHAFTVNQAMLDYPWAVHGRGEANTVVLEELGLTAKLGAEGVLVVAAPNGTSAAVKVLDGSSRATNLVALSLLAARGVIELDDLGPVLRKIVKPITGGRAAEQVGSIRLAPALLDRL